MPGEIPRGVPVEMLATQHATKPEDILPYEELLADAIVGNQVRFARVGLCGGGLAHSGPAAEEHAARAHLQARHVGTGGVRRNWLKNDGGWLNPSS